MTDLSLTPSTLPVPHADPLTAPLVVASTAADLDNKPLINGYVAEEEEDYTIKCVCDYEDDDGNTVQCETCETWQHIECYYPGTKGPGEQETHNCVDCDPRPVDAKRATEGQRLRRVELDLGDRKPKKPAAPSTKGQKKKLKAENTNGWHETLPRNGTSGSPKESQTAKRPKASHRSSNSTTQIVPLKLPGQSRRSASASHTLQSPSKISSPFRQDSDQFSEIFVHLYDDDPGEKELPSNLVSIPMINKLIEWSGDPEAVRKDANGKSQKDIFFRCDQPLETISLPILHKQKRVDELIECHGAHPTWVYLTVESETPQNAILGELRGQIGQMTDYVQDERNRWDDIRHPLPFVFFHPNLPIYIDTRREGTICRYVRRSCRPNVHLKTILEGSDYHFCLVANTKLQPGEQLTIPWTPDEHVRAIIRRLENHKEEKVQGDGSEEDEEYVRQFFAKVLADFGGCACDDPATCFVRMWDRRKVQDGKLPNGKSKRGRRAGGVKSGQPGRAASSRSGSEALKYRDDDDDDDDSHSTSASSRGKPNSRDLTPSHDLDHLGPDVDDRTKRKIAALEKQEHEKHQPAAKKKKRNSGGTSLSVRDAPASASRINFPDSGLNGKIPQGSTSVPSTPSINAKSRYVDAGTNRKTSNSPVSQFAPSNAQRKGSNPRSPVASSQLSHAQYVDSSVQCDMDEEEHPPPRTCAKRPFQSLSKRLLKRFHQDRSRFPAKREDSEEQKSELASPVAQHALTLSPTAASTENKDADGDVSMGEAQVAKPRESPSLPKLEEPRPTSSGTAPSSDVVAEISTSPAPSSPQISTTSLVDKKAITNGHRLPNLHVPMPPRQPFNPPTTVSATAPTSVSIVTAGPTPTPSAQTPTNAAPLLTPGGTSVVQPSPIKKKLSLGDYMSRRGNIARAESAASTGSASGNISSPTAGPGQSGARKDSDAAGAPLGTVSEESADVLMKDQPNGSDAVDAPDKDNGSDVITGPIEVDTSKLSTTAIVSTQEDVKMGEATS